MKPIMKGIKKDYWSYLPYALILVGVLIRFYQLGVVPGGINQDEAFAGYEAYSLLNFGIDSSGYHNPVYFTSWGSGMNVLNSYLMIPFIKIFGVHTWVVRIPQALVGSLSLFVFYKLLQKIFNEKIALIGLFVLVINPWHIMLSKWALESNLAPGFLLFGLYFFILGVDKPKYYILSALAYGLSLYAYATIWPIVPVILLLQFLYLLFSKKLKFSIELVIAIGVLVLLGIPLLLFILINSGHMEEIKTGIFSIPKLVYMRDNEISFENIGEKFYNVYNIIATQNDGLPWNTTEEFGLYYKFSLPFIVLGMFYLCRTIVLEIKTKVFSLKIFVVIQLLAALLLGILVNVNINRINCLHLGMIICLALGIYYLSELTKKEVVGAVIFLYAISFLGFQSFYYTSYKERIAVHFEPGLDKAVSFAMEQANGNETIYVDENICYVKILFFSSQDTEEYVNTVQYSNYPSAFLGVNSFGKFSFITNNTIASEDDVYIIKSDNAPTFMNRGFAVEYFETFAVAYFN